jgi:hypothetical protein
LVSRHGPSLRHQTLEPGRQRKGIRRVALALDRHVAGAIVATDQESDVVAEGLVDVATDVVVRPGQIELEIEMADGIVPPGIVLRRARDLRGLGLEGVAGGARRLLLGIAALARGAVGDEEHDRKHRQRDQGGDRKGHLPLKATAQGPGGLTPSSDQSALSASKGRSSPYAAEVK